MPWHPESNPHFGPSQGEYFQSPTSRVSTPEQQDQHTLPLSEPVPRISRPKLQDRHKQPTGAWVRELSDHIETQRPRVPQPQLQGQHPHEPQGHHPDHPHGLMMEPPPRPNKIKTWCFAGFWASFWTGIVLVGLIVLIIYLINRPHNPQFDVSNVTLNTASLDAASVLHADLTMLVNFTNPNRKANFEFRYEVLDLYYGRTVIASQTVEPFLLEGAEYRLENVFLVTAQVQLPEAETERFKMQISYNAVEFEIKGEFRARAHLGGVLRYSYRLRADCIFKVNGPPTGAMIAKYCKTKS